MYAQTPIGPLGKGITVAKVQVALTSRDRFICKTIEREAKNVEDSQTALAELTNTVCLALLRNSDDWVGACSESKWFAGNDSGKAEQLCNQWSNKEASKFEKEFIPRSDDNTEPGGATTVIVSIVIEIQGDSTNFEGAGFSLAGTKDVVSSLASNCLVDEGYCVNAAEVFWCPSDRSEVLTSRDVIIDFPEIIDL